MPSYSYVAVSGRGKRVRDSMEAASLDMAKNSLRGAGYTILEIILEVSGGQSGIAHLAHLGGFLGGYCFLKVLFGSSLPWDPFRHRVRPGEWKRPPAWGDAARPSAEPPPAGGPVSPRELDALLDKISREGINSLSEHELARLRQAREEMRGGRG